MASQNIPSSVDLRNAHGLKYFLNKYDSNFFKLCEGRGYDLLLKAIQNNQFLLAKYFLSKGCRVNSEIFDSRKSVLHCAIEKGNIDLIEMLLTNGAVVNIKNYLGFTPLHVASSYSNLKIRFEMVALLLKHGADMHAINKEGVSPLALAIDYSIRTDDIDLIKIFLENKDKFVGGNYKNCIFWKIVKSGNLKLVKLILEYCVDVNIRYVGNNTILHLLSLKTDGSKKILDIVELLVNRGVSTDVQNFFGKTPLHYAISSRKKEFVKIFLNETKQINLQDKDGNTPLLLALDAKSYDIFTLVLCQMLQRCTQKNEVLSSFIINSEYDILELVTQLKCNNFLESLDDFRTQLDIQNLNGDTALHFSTSMENEMAVIWLLNYGAKIDVKNVFGNTPLHLASKQCLNSAVRGVLPRLSAFNDFDSSMDMQISCTSVEQIIEVLLNHGADCNSLNELGNTPLHYAAYEESLELVTILKNHGAKFSIQNNQGNTALHIATNKGSIRLVENFPILPTDCNIRNCHGRTPLHLAATKNYLDLAMILLKRGADCNVQNKWGNTVLHEAVEAGHYEFVTLLLRHGSSCNIPNNSGNTVLHTAVNKGDIDTVALLMPYSTDCNIQNNEGNTPLHLAARRKDLTAVKFMVNYGADVIIKNRYRFTPLFYAVSSGSFGVTEFILKSHPCVDSEQKYYTRIGKSLLRLALKFNDKRFFKLLLKYKADVNDEDKHGRTVLHYAIIDNQTHLLECILRLSDDIDACDCSLMSPLKLAILYGHKEIVEKLIEYGVRIKFSFHNEKNYLIPMKKYGYRNDFGINAAKQLGADYMFKLIKLQNFTPHMNETWLMGTPFAQILQSELNRMVEEPIGKNTSLTFYNMLKCKDHLLVRFASNTEVRRAILSGSHKLNFPSYASFISGQFWIGDRRLRLIRKSLKHFFYLFSGLPTLPVECVERLIQYLTNKDLIKVSQMF